MLIEGWQLTVTFGKAFTCMDSSNQCLFSGAKNDIIVIDNLPYITKTL